MINITIIKGYIVAGTIDIINIDEIDEEFFIVPIGDAAVKEEVIFNEIEKYGYGNAKLFDASWESMLAIYNYFTNTHGLTVTWEYHMANERPMYNMIFKK